MKAAYSKSEIQGTAVIDGDGKGRVRVEDMEVGQKLELRKGFDQLGEHAPEKQYVCENCTDEAGVRTGLLNTSSHAGATFRGSVHVYPGHLVHRSGSRK